MKSGSSWWQQYRSLIIQGLSLMVVLAIWEAISRADIAAIVLFPSIERIAKAGAELLVSRGFFTELSATVRGIATGFAIGALVGIPVGGVLGRSRYLGQVFEPYIDYFGTMPKIIIFPLLIWFFGVGVNSKIAMGALSAFFPIVINAFVGFHEVNPVFLRVARSAGANTFQTFTKVYMPSILGPLVAGSRLGVATATIGVLLAETKAAQAGLGTMAMGFYSELMPEFMYAVLILIFVGAMIVNLLLSIVSNQVAKFTGGGEARGFLL